MLPVLKEKFIILFDGAGGRLEHAECRSDRPSRVIVSDIIIVLERKGAALLMIWGMVGKIDAGN